MKFLTPSIERGSTYSVGAAYRLVAIDGLNSCRLRISTTVYLRFKQCTSQIPVKKANQLDYHRDESDYPEMENLPVMVITAWWSDLGTCL